MRQLWNIFIYSDAPGLCAQNEPLLVQIRPANQEIVAKNYIPKKARFKSATFDRKTVKGEGISGVKQFFAFLGRSNETTIKYFYIFGCAWSVRTKRALTRPNPSSQSGDNRKKLQSKKSPL